MGLRTPSGERSYWQEVWDVGCKLHECLAQIGSKEVVNDRWLKLTADRCQLPSGSVLDPYYVLHDSDWVHVFAQDQDGRVVIVRQYRYAVGATCVELPGGVVDQGEHPLAAAKRELLEETGYSAAEWLPVGSMYANPARQTNSVHVFIEFSQALHVASFYRSLRLLQSAFPATV